MRQSLSLRVRLILVILTPLVAIATLIGAWAYSDAQKNAAERFDRSLLSTALAISRDIAVSGGDALSSETRDLLRDTSGGSVFYHVYAPDGVFVTGYATPPVPPTSALESSNQAFYDAVYQGADVRALRVIQSTSIDGLSGLFTFTVWQNTEVFDGFVRSRTQPVFLIIASMIGALGLIVWFGVATGLAPLTDLEEAIARRSSDDLSPIKRQIPRETSGIVGRLNELLNELAMTMREKDVFISDAAHQLRNPIAGVLSLADAVEKAPDLEQAKLRSRDLAEAAREAGRLTNNLLTLERMSAADGIMSESFDPFEVIAAVEKAFRAENASDLVALEASLSPQPATLFGNRTMFQEAIKNLLDNAILHGGESLSTIRLRAQTLEGSFVVKVSDNGRGIKPADFQRALGRFSQIGPSAGTGLGLPIAKAAAESFGGRIELTNEDGFFGATLTMPLTDGATHLSPSD